MSRIGKMPITVPAGVTVTIEDNHVTVKGPKGELARQINKNMKLTMDNGVITVERPDDEKESRSLHGLSRTLINNMIIGVTQGFSKTLEINGVGYRAAKQGQNINFTLRLQISVLCVRLNLTKVKVSVTKANMFVVRLVKPALKARNNF